MFCRLWIPGYAALAAPPYPLTRDSSPFTWGADQQKAFDGIKQALLTAPALALPDVSKPFDLYMHEEGGGQRGADPTLRPLEEASGLSVKETGSSGHRLAPLLRIIAAVALLLKDADKLTFGQAMTVLAPHALESVVCQPPDCRLINARLMRYQSLLLNSKRVKSAP